MAKKDTAGSNDNDQSGSGASRYALYGLAGVGLLAGAGAG